jgi:hypothetical protein
MIRRNPTLIAMSDLDVQDVRMHVARAKLAGSSPDTGPDTGAGGSASADIAPARTGPVVAAEDAKRKRDAMGRDERLGLA